MWSDLTFGWSDLTDRVKFAERTDFYFSFIFLCFDWLVVFWCSLLFHNNLAETVWDQAYVISQKSSDTPVLLNTNEIKAVKKMVFGVCRALMGIEKVSPPIPRYSVQLAPVVELIAREQRLHQLSSPVIKTKVNAENWWGKESITTDHSIVQTWT